MSLYLLLRCVQPSSHRREPLRLHSPNAHIHFIGFPLLCFPCIPSSRGKIEHSIFCISLEHLEHNSQINKNATPVSDLSEESRDGRRWFMTKLTINQIYLPSLFLNGWTSQSRGTVGWQAGSMSSNSMAPALCPERDWRYTRQIQIWARLEIK